MIFIIIHLKLHDFLSSEKFALNDYWQNYFIITKTLKALGDEVFG